jgi:hypothetical protein
VIIGLVNRDGDIDLGQRGEPEPFGRGCHLQRLVRSVRVVVADACVELSLSGLH